MDINAIILELLGRIKNLEDKVRGLEDKLSEKDAELSDKGGKPLFPSDKISGKYRALAEYLYERWEKKIRLSYGEIESILDFKLPPTAYKLPNSYWANTLTHSYATSWLCVGYKARVDTNTLHVTFERTVY